MSDHKIDKVKLYRLLISGKSQKEAAQVFGVTEGAIQKGPQHCRREEFGPGKRP
jgi:hypothetical protein